MALAFVAMAAASCLIEDNPRYCDAKTPCTDPSRMFCDVAGKYRASGGARNLCIPRPGCESDQCEAEAPVCDLVSETCASCRQDADCARFGDANLCAPDGSCVGCRLNSDCASDACHPLTHECASEADVLYLVAGAPETSDCTRAAPCGDLRRALALASPPRSIIRMAPGDYGGSVAIGPGVLAIIADPGAILAPRSADPVPAETVVIEAGADVLLQGLIIIGPGSSGENVAAIRCEDYSAEAATHLHLDLGRVSSAGAAGIEAHNCAVDITQSAIAKNGRGIVASGGRLDVSRSVISENTAGGMLLSSVAVVFRNNFVWGNGSPTGGVVGGALLVDLSAGSSFEHNTVVGNAAQNGVPGVACSGNLTLSNNIIHGNADGQQVGGCSHRFSLIGPTAEDGPGNVNQAPVFVDPSSRDNLHLDPSSPGIDQAEPSDVREDIDGQVRPQGAGPDIGADELTPGPQGQPP
jgi:hypothetical protein